MSRGRGDKTQLKFSHDLLNANIYWLMSGKKLNEAFSFYFNNTAITQFAHQRAQTS